MKEKILFTVKGKVQVQQITPGGIDTIATFTNDVQSSGKGLLAKALYSPSTCLNTMYMLFCTGEPPYLTPGTGNITAAELRELPDVNYMRVPIIQAGIDDNVLTVQGITDENKLGKQSPPFNDSSARIFAVGLVHSPIEDDASADILFSAANLKTSGGSNTYITKVANAQIGVLWTVTIGLGS